MACLWVHVGTAVQQMFQKDSDMNHMGLISDQWEEGIWKSQMPLNLVILIAGFRVHVLLKLILEIMQQHIRGMN